MGGGGYDNLLGITLKFSFMDDRVVAFRSHIGRMLGGINEALVFQQLMFNSPVDGDWFYLSAAEIEEATLVKPDAQRRARENMVKLGVLVERHWDHNRMQFRIDWAMVEQRYGLMAAEWSRNAKRDSITSRSGKTRQPEVGKRDSSRGRGPLPSLEKGREERDPPYPPVSSPTLAQNVLTSAEEDTEPSLTKREEATRRVLAYALVDIWMKETGVKAVDRSQESKDRAMKVVFPQADQILPEDFRACIRYLRSDPWWCEVGRTTMKAVVERFPEWIGAGKPDRVRDPKQAQREEALDNQRAVHAKYGIGSAADETVIDVEWKVNP